MHCDAVPVIRDRKPLVSAQRTDWGNRMPDSKHLNLADDFDADAKEAKDASEQMATPPRAANDADGWEHYRQWVSKAPAPRGRRSGIDPALYTWKGYRNWTEQVRRNWKPDGTDDSD